MNIELFYERFSRKVTPQREEIIKGEEKIGPDWNGKAKQKSLRNFLS
jgi:hypothetical protein